MGVVDCEVKNMQIMDLEEYLAKEGCAFATSGYCLDKLRSNRTIRTERGKRRFAKECAEAEEKYQTRRNTLIEKYNKLVEAGEIRPLTSIERTIRKANGHPDNPSVQAARRMCKKCGIDWRTSAC